MGFGCVCAGLCKCVGLGVSVQVCGYVCVCRCVGVGVSVQVCGCRCVCAGVWVCLHMCSVWGNSNYHYFHIILYIIIYSSNFSSILLSLSLPSSHHLLISCLLQLKSLHPFAFGDSASDHSKMQGFVRQLQEVETHSTEYVKSVTYIPSHTRMHWVRYLVTCLRRDHPGTS